MIRTLVRLPALLLSLSACGGGNDRGGGNLTLAVADAPVDNARRIVVAFTGVELKPQDGDVVQFNFAPRQIDLLALSGGGSELLLGGVDVPTGAYSSARLKINAAQDSLLDSFIELTDGSQHELAMPDDAAAGLRINQSYVVPERGSAGFTIDFDLRRSVLPPDGAAITYELRPVLRLVNNVVAGAVTGSVDFSRIPAGCAPAVYVFDGANATPDDVDGSNPEPLTSALVNRDTGTYTAAFLPADDYTVAFTCDAAGDSPRNDDTLTFQDSQNATVTAGQTVQADFGPVTPSPSPVPGF